MSQGMPSMTALLGMLALAGYQNRDKISEVLTGAGTSGPNTGAGQSGLGGLLGSLGGLLGGAGSTGARTGRVGGRRLGAAGRIHRRADGGRTAPDATAGGRA